MNYFEDFGGQIKIQKILFNALQNNSHACKNKIHKILKNNFKKI